MIELLIVLICWAVFLQPTRPRAIVAAVYAIPTLAHHVASDAWDDRLYFLSAALVDLSVIAMLALYQARGSLGAALQRVSLASIVLNAAGWVAWMAYLPPTAYVVSFAVLYSWALWELLGKARPDDGVGLATVDRRRVRLWGHPGAGHPIDRNHKGTP